MSKSSKKAGGHVTTALPRPPSVLERWSGDAVAVALALIILFRVQYDGMTYPFSNCLFTLAVGFLFSLWGLTRLLSGGGLRFSLEGRLFAALFGVMLLTTATTVQLDATFRSLQNWATYLLAFLLVINALTLPRQRAIVLGAFAVAVLGEAIWSIFHLEYILPLTRKELAANPNLLVSYFDTDKMTPELADRLNMNRAFGSFMFPNALGAFLMFGIAFAVGAAVSTWARLEAAKIELSAPVSEFTQRYAALALSVVALFLTLCPAYFLFSTGYQIVFMDSATGAAPLWTAHPLGWVLVVGVFPIACAVAVFALIAAGGLRKGWLRIQLAVLIATVAMGVTGLWASASRGAMLGLFAGAVAIACLLWWGKRKPSGHLAATAAFILLCSGLIGHALQPVSAEAQAPGAATATAHSTDAAGLNQIEFGGQGPRLASGATVKARLDYWQTGLRMFLSNPLTGVGPGNYGTVCSTYQTPGAATSQQAHNDFLQVACETGVGGLALFAVFWGVLLYTSARRFAVQGDVATRALHAGIWAALVAFLVHSLVDFNFVSPGLSLFAFTLAGFLVAPPRNPRPAWIAQGAMVLFIVIAMFTSGNAVRVYRSDQLFGRDNVHNAQFALANAVFGSSSGKPLIVQADMLLSFGLDRATIEANSILGVKGPAGLVPISKEQPMDISTLAAITDPAKGRRMVVEGISRWLGTLQRADTIYPHNPEIAQKAAAWYERLYQYIPDTARRREYAIEMQKWAEKAVERSPKQAHLRTYLGSAFWLRAGVDTSPSRMEYYDKGLEEYRKAAQLFPGEPGVWTELASALDAYGNSLKGAGMTDRAKSMLDEAARARQQASTVESERQRRQGN